MLRPMTMSYSVSTITGVTEAHTEKLAAAGISNSQQLLEKAKSPKDRATLAEATGIDVKAILKWANHADLMRIKGIAAEFAELLEAAGVDTVKELRHRNAENLTKRLAELIEQDESLTRRVPTQKLVEDWIAQASEMEPTLTY